MYIIYIYIMIIYMGYVSGTGHWRGGALADFMFWQHSWLAVGFASPMGDHLRYGPLLAKRIQGACGGSQP